MSDAALKADDLYEKNFISLQHSMYVQQKRISCSPHVISSIEDSEQST